MLTLYRRHTKNCPHREKGRRYIRCSCPVWCDGTLNGAEFRRTVDTADWNLAQHRILAWQTKGFEQLEDQPEHTIRDLAERYVADMESRGLVTASQKKYKMLFRQLEAFVEERKVDPRLRKWNFDTMSTFRQGWGNKGLGAVKKLERLKTVLKFACEAGWIEKNPAEKLKPPTVKDKPTLPFSEQEMREILRACETYKGKRLQLRAVILLMRYSGLRIGDAVTLAQDRVVGDILFLYTAKTGVPVRLPLPESLLDALAAFEPESERFYFWSGLGDKDAFSRMWMKKLNRTFEAAGIKDGHSHRFRDTFAVELLLSGVPLERVSMLLGHSSIKVTQKHYNPWVKARQAQLEDDVRKSWSSDALAARKDRAKVVPNHRVKVHARYKAEARKL